LSQGVGKRWQIRRTMATRTKAEKYQPILGGFIPLQALWDQGAGGALFPSETSAEYFIRTHRAALVEVDAIAIHMKRMMVHRERFEAVAQRLALDRARRAA
jgi:hypothetical protein